MKGDKGVPLGTGGVEGETSACDLLVGAVWLNAAEADTESAARVGDDIGFDDAMPAVAWSAHVGEGLEEGDGGEGGESGGAGVSSAIGVTGFGHVVDIGVAVGVSGFATAEGVGDAAGFGIGPPGGGEGGLGVEPE